jgi:hypothetical protein
MTNLTHAVAPAATRGALLQAHAVIVTAALAGFAALSWLTSPLAAAPLQSATTQPSPHRMAVHAAPASPLTAIGTTVPEASAVFAGRAAVLEESAPPF